MKSREEEWRGEKSRAKSREKERSAEYSKKSAAKSGQKSREKSGAKEPMAGEKQSKEGSLAGCAGGSSLRWGGELRNLEVSEKDKSSSEAEFPGPRLAKLREPPASKLAFVTCFPERTLSSPNQQWTTNTCGYAFFVNVNPVPIHVYVYTIL